MYRDVLFGTVDQIDAGVVLNERPKERGMAREKRDLAPTSGAGNDLICLARVENPLG